MDHDDDGETSYNTFVDDVAFEPTYSQALLTAAGRNVATLTYGTSAHRKSFLATVAWSKTVVSPNHFLACIVGYTALQSISTRFVSWNPRVLMKFLTLSQSHPLSRLSLKCLAKSRPKYITTVLWYNYLCRAFECIHWVNKNKKAVLSQGNRAMPQLFFSV